jgi:hypothetical protein
MKLPKIKKEDLPEELQKILGDDDEIEFEPMVSPEDVFDLSMTDEEYQIGRLETARKLIESRKKLEEYRQQVDKTEEF